MSDGWWADVTDLVKRGGTVQVALDGVVEGRAASRTRFALRFELCQARNTRGTISG